MSLSGLLLSIMMLGMVIDMNDRQFNTLVQLQAFLDGTMAVDFAVAVDERYDFIARTLQRFGYRRLPRAGKGWCSGFWNGSAAIRANSSPDWLSVGLGNAHLASVTAP